MPDFDFDYEEEVEISELRFANFPPFHIGFAPASRTMYLEGNIHPLGAFSAIMAAAKQNVPYISLGALSALFPELWLRAECMHDPTRLALIDNICRSVRGTG